MYHITPEYSVACILRASLQASLLIDVAFFFGGGGCGARQEVLGHIKKENDYTEAKMEHLKGLREDLYKVGGRWFPFDLVDHMEQLDKVPPVGFSCPCILG